jgi:Zn-dependent protease with chaperone function
MSQSKSIARRALLAVVLMLGFYALSISVAIGLLYIPYAEVVYLKRLDFRPALFCVVGAGLILWSILPRFDRFEAPGPRLNEDGQPALFAVLRDLAAATGQELPREVYLIPDLNAWVALRGGVMGIGSRRVMGLGLPLLQILSLTQFRAVLAHEFGHYYGGDTSLGPWVYKTRAAIGRTIERLSWHSSILSKPFLFYGLLFLRLTLSVSRQQELSADQLAARTIGGRPLIDGLKLVHAAALAYVPYVGSEIVPALKAGYRPPMSDGFKRFLSAEAISKALSEFMSKELAEGEANPYDSHPALKERIAALGESAEGRAEDDDAAPALSLLADVDALEGKLMSFIFSDYANKGFKPVSWEEMSEKVWMPLWKDRLRENRHRLKGLTADQLPELLREPSALAVKMLFAPGASVTNDQHRNEAEGLLGSALVLAFASRGGTVCAPPGESVRVELHGRSFAPFSLADEFSSGALKAEDWLAICKEAGVHDLEPS